MAANEVGTGVAARTAPAAVAIAAFGLFVWLGFYVNAYGEPALFVGLERALLDHSTLIAWWLTWGCYVYVLIPIVAMLGVLAWRLPRWRGRIVFSIAMLVVSWRAADLCQRLFARPRRLDWVVHHETSFSYPSSHAAIVAGFYWLWAALLLASNVPRTVRTGLAIALTGLGIAICWSRLSLGAHYLTDLIGGALLGIALASAAIALVPKIVRPA